MPGRGGSLVELTPRRDATRVALFGVAGTGLLAVASRGLVDQKLSFTTAALLALGVLAWVGATWIAEPWSAATRPATPCPVSFPLLVTAAVLVVGAWVSSGGGVYTNATLAFWPAGTAAWLLAWWPRKPRKPRTTLPPLSRSAVLTMLALGAVVCAAALFHFHDLSSVPGDPTSDHAEKLLDVRDVLDGEHPIFFPRNSGREPAQFYVAAAQVKLLGQPLAWETLKSGTAAVGVLAVLAIFLVGRELGGPVVGLTASALAAVSPWLLGVDRIGLRFSYAILASALVLWLLFRYLRTGDRRAVLLCGLALAFGVHGYSPFRIVLVAAAVVFGVAVAHAARTGTWRIAMADAALAYGTALFASIPLVHYAIRHPDLVFMRQTSRLDASSGVRASLSTFAGNLKDALLAFNWRGGSIWTVALPNEPFLDFVTGAALVAGVVVLATVAVRGRSLVAVSALALLPVLTLGSALNLAFPEENPAANRMGVAAPLVFAVAAVPAGLLWSALQTAASAPAPRRLALLTLGSVLLLIGGGAVAATNYKSYFRDYRDAYTLRAEPTTEVARAIAKLGVPPARTFLVSYPHSLDARNLGFALGDVDWHLENNIEPGLPIPPLRGKGRAGYVLAAEDAGNRRELHRRFPSARYVPVSTSVAAHDFGVYVVDGLP